MEMMPISATTRAASHDEQLFRSIKTGKVSREEK
jgi:hypothetical protein